MSYKSNILYYITFTTFYKIFFWNLQKLLYIKIITINQDPLPPCQIPSMGYRAIYALFLLVRPSSSDVFVPGQVWYSTTIQTSFLDPPLANTPGSRMKCASLANLSPDCHLFCLSGDFCSLYRAQVAAFHQPPPGYETSSCWTRNFDCMYICRSPFAEIQ